MTRSSKRAQATIVAALLAAGVLLGAPAAAAGADVADGQTEYVVLAEQGASAADVLAAIGAAGGTVISRNAAIGSFRVLGPRTGFVLAVSTSAAVYGATRERAIGRTPGAAPVKVSDPEVEKVHQGGGTQRNGRSKAKMDPLDSLAWGLAMVKADRARKVEDGSRRVLVGILDSGIDASHPDLKGQLETRLSRNFTTDIPEVDGPCEVPSCVDPPTADDSGHGTHVAGTVAAAANGLGVSGVAPGVRLVSIRGGQDSGFLFLGPVTNALTYGADIGVDVINMSFYVDPWLYNCIANPADSPEAQAEQRTIIAAMNRALDYAHSKYVTLVGSLGNNHEDLGKPRTDLSSPDFPPVPDITYPRPIDNATCWDLPVEGHHVIGVSALGPSTAKADYSNYGLEQISVSAPGGWFRDGFGTPTFRTNGNQILSTYPLHVLQEDGLVDAEGNITPDGETLGVMKDCKGSTCGYYAYLQGTSMASPHATGVAALAVSRFGVKDPRHKGGLRLAPWKTELVLTKGAAEHACPRPRLYDYTIVGRPAEFNALCEGKKKFNGFYGHGIVDAYATVTRKFKFDDDD